MFEIGAPMNPSYHDTLEHTYFKIENFIFGNEKIVFFTYRIFSVLGNWIVDFGIIGLFLALFFLYFIWQRSISEKSNKQFYLLWASGFITFCFFIKINAANPTIWALFSIIMYNEQIKSLKN